jgi:hypothetical protein
VFCWYKCGYAAYLLLEMAKASNMLFVGAQ